MNAAHSLIPLALILASPLAAAQPTDRRMPDFAVVLQPAVVEFHIAQPASPFLGIVLLSLSPNLQHFLVDLPPLLDQAIVLDYGIDSDGMFSTRFRDTVFPPGVMLYAQGVTIGDAGILSSEVRSFVLDATGSGGG